MKVKLLKKIRECIDIREGINGEYHLYIKGKHSPLSYHIDFKSDFIKHVAKYNSLSDCREKSREYIIDYINWNHGGNKTYAN